MGWPTITIDTPLSEVQEIHKRIWDYVIEHGEKPPTPYEANCILCEFDSMLELFCHWKNVDPHCMFCPVEVAPSINCLGGLYARWNTATDPGAKAELAKQIRNIPFKEEAFWKQDS